MLYYLDHTDSRFYLLESCGKKSVSVGALSKGSYLLVDIPFDKLIHIKFTPIFNQDSSNCIYTDGTRWCLLSTASETVDGLPCFPAQAGEVNR